MGEQESKTGVQILKAYFTDPPIANKELLELRKVDPNGYDELVGLVAEDLGVTVQRKIVTS